MEYTCTNCGKVYISKLHKRYEHNFCCKECETEYKYNMSHETRICEYCGKEFVCAKGEKLRFCGMKCQAEWQRNVLQTDERRAMQREITLRTLHGNFIKNQHSKPCVKIENLLRENNIEFECEKRLGSFSIDICVYGDRYIEIMGDYWHLNPMLFDEPNNQQLRH